MWPTPAGTPAAVSFKVPGTPEEVWNFVNSAVQDTLFLAVTAQPFELMVARSIRRGLVLRVDLVPQRESTFVAVSGTRYIGPSDRPGFALAAAEYWPSIRSGEPAMAELLVEGNRIRSLTNRGRRAERERVTSVVAAGGRPEIQPLLAAPVSADSIVRALSDGTLGYCRANTVRVGRHLDTLMIVDVVDRPEWCPLPSYMKGSAGNTFVLRSPASVAIGDTLSVCIISGGTRGYQFEQVAWHHDSVRCRRDASFRQQSEPNMKLLRRIE